MVTSHPLSHPLFLLYIQVGYQCKSLTLLDAAVWWEAIAKSNSCGGSYSVSPPTTTLRRLMIGSSNREHETPTIAFRLGCTGTGSLHTKLFWYLQNNFGWVGCLPLCSSSQCSGRSRPSSSPCRASPEDHQGTPIWYIC